MIKFPWDDLALHWQALIWGFIVVVVGGVISLIAGQGFWGEKTEPGTAYRSFPSDFDRRPMVLAPPAVKYLVEPKVVDAPPGKWESKAPTRKVAVASQAATLSSYQGTCELPKVVREETNSAACLMCHDGSGHGTLINLNNSHSVGVSMPWGSPGYKMQDPRIVLPAGNVECTSCHDYWYVPQQAFWAALPPSELCSACHDK